MNTKETEKQEAIKELKKELRPGQEVQCILRHVSRSGMQRRIDFLTMKGGKPRYLTWLIAKALDYRTTGNGGGLIVDGCGMDVGFSVVYDLGVVLWPKGNGKYTTGRNGDTTPETDGGYFLKHHWL